jgi:tetratricopeptide (TPR) repeat protein
VCVHHPTDIARISKFDPAVATIFPNLAEVHSKDFLEAGNAKFADGKMVDAIDCYAEGIKQARIARHGASDSENFRGLLLKRASAYVRLDLHSMALLDISELLDADGNHQRALKLGCIVCLELGKYETAQRYVSALTTLAPEDKANKMLDEKVATRVKQAKGNFNLGEIAKSVKQADVVSEVSDFVGPIEIRKSELGGRGMFAKCKIGQGPLLLCEKPLALLTEDNQSVSSLTKGLKNVMTGNDEYLLQGTMSLVQFLASKTATDPVLFERFLDLYDGESKEASGTAEPKAKVFNR